LSAAAKLISVIACAVLLPYILIGLTILLVSLGGASPESLLVLRVGVLMVFYFVAGHWLQFRNIKIVFLIYAVLFSVYSYFTTIFPTPSKSIEFSFIYLAAPLVAWSLYCVYSFGRAYIVVATIALFIFGSVVNFDGTPALREERCIFIPEEYDAFIASLQAESVQFSLSGSRCISYEIGSDLDREKVELSLRKAQEILPPPGRSQSWRDDNDEVARKLAAIGVEVERPSYNGVEFLAWPEKDKARVEKYLNSIGFAPFSGVEEISELKK
jgi:hypothetical protein